MTFNVCMCRAFTGEKGTKQYEDLLINSFLDQKSCIFGLALAQYSRGFNLYDENFWLALACVLEEYIFYFKGG